MKRVFPIYMLALLVLASCEKVKKNGNENPLSPYTNYTFQNKTGEAITVRVADTVTGDVFYLEIGPNVSMPIPLSQLKDGERIRPLTYYWATKNFEMSSWYTASEKDLRKNAEATYSNGRYIYNIPITPVYRSKRMKYFLNSIDGATTWVAVDAYDSTGKSVWNTLSNAAKNHQVKLDCRKTGTHDHANSIGATTRDYFYYDFVYDSIQPPLDIMIYTRGYSSADTSIHSGYHFRMANDLSGYKGGRVSNKTTDTLFMMINTKPPYYKMAKQPAS